MRPRGPRAGDEPGAAADRRRTAVPSRRARSTGARRSAGRGGANGRGGVVHRPCPRHRPAISSRRPKTSRAIAACAVGSTGCRWRSGWRLRARRCSACRALESRLHERLQLLAADSRDAPTRQQTLLAALDGARVAVVARAGIVPPARCLRRRLHAWSWRSRACSDGRQRRMGSHRWAGKPGGSFADELEAGDPPRYRMLESQRAYALHRLAACDGELRTAQHRHARAVAAVLWDAAETLWSTPDDASLLQWAPELDNLRAALDWSQTNDTALFVSLIGSGVWLFRPLDLDYELRRRADAVDVEAVRAIDPMPQTRYWYARAVLQAGVAAEPAQTSRARPSARRARAATVAGSTSRCAYHRGASARQRMRRRRGSRRSPNSSRRNGRRECARSAAWPSSWSTPSPLGGRKPSGRPRPASRWPSRRARSC